MKKETSSLKIIFCFAITLLLFNTSRAQKVKKSHPSPFLSNSVSIIDEGSKENINSNNDVATESPFAKTGAFLNYTQCWQDKYKKSDAYQEVIDQDSSNIFARATTLYFKLHGVKNSLPRLGSENSILTEKSIDQQKKKGHYLLKLLKNTFFAE